MPLRYRLSNDYGSDLLERMRRENVVFERRTSGLRFLNCLSGERCRFVWLIACPWYRHCSPASRGYLLFKYKTFISCNTSDSKKKNYEEYVTHRSTVNTPCTPSITAFLLFARHPSRLCLPTHSTLTQSKAALRGKAHRSIDVVEYDMLDICWSICHLKKA